jgi:hypothetical protein
MEKQCKLLFGHLSLVIYPGVRNSEEYVRSENKMRKKTDIELEVENVEWRNDISIKPRN